MTKTWAPQSLILSPVVWYEESDGTSGSGLNPGCRKKGEEDVLEEQWPFRWWAPFLLQTWHGIQGDDLMAAFCFCWLHPFFFPFALPTTIKTENPSGRTAECGKSGQAAKIYYAMASTVSFILPSSLQRVCVPLVFGIERLPLFVHSLDDLVAQRCLTN